MSADDEADVEEENDGAPAASGDQGDGGQEDGDRIEP